MSDGIDCKCAAHNESECGCGADWTPQEVYDLRAENQRLKDAIRRLADHDATLSVCDGDVTVTMDQGWIHVSERLPDEGHAILLWDGYVRRSGYMNQWNRFVPVPGDLNTKGITHWFPYPEPPNP